MFIDNETDGLYSSNLQEEFFEFRGQKYENRPSFSKDNARQLYPEFGIYKMYEEDIPEYKKVTVIINGKNLDQYYRDNKYAKETSEKLLQKEDQPKWIMEI